MYLYLFVQIHVSITYRICTWKILMLSIFILGYQLRTVNVQTQWITVDVQCTLWCQALCFIVALQQIQSVATNTKINLLLHVETSTHPCSLCSLFLTPEHKGRYFSQCSFGNSHCQPVLDLLHFVPAALQIPQEVLHAC